MKKLAYIAVLLISLSACTKEQQAYPVSIVADLQPYIDRFVAEGEQRGITVDFSIEGLSAQLVSIATQGVPGQCQQYSEQENELLIDRSFWDFYTEEQREVLIFHELGHCYLNRDHKDSSDVNGNCLSLMRSTTTICLLENYSLERATLLNELFE